MLMSYFLFLLYLSLSRSFVNCQLVNYTNYRLVRVKPKNDGDNQVLREMKKQFKIDLWNNPRRDWKPLLVKFGPDQMPYLESLKKNSIDYEIVSDNLQDIIDRYWQELQVYRNLSADFDFIHKYHTYEEISKELLRVAKDPVTASLVKIGTIGMSYEGREIWQITISAPSNTTVQKDSIVFECGIHAREWISPAFCLYLINQLLSTDKSKLNDYEFVIIPVFNVDGYCHTWTGDRMWRKTRSISKKKPHCRGVDANRNFDVHFCEIGVSIDPCEEDYCGDNVFSEPEASAWRDFLLKKKGRIAMYMAVHNYNQQWLLPHAYTTTKPKNSQKLENLASIGIKALQSVHGTKYDYGTLANIYEPSSGTSLDWVYDKLGVKIAYGIELRDTGEHGFLLPPSLIKPTCEEAWAGIKAVIEHL